MTLLAKKITRLVSGMKAKSTPVTMSPRMAKLTHGRLKAGARATGRGGDGKSRIEMKEEGII